MNVSEAWMFAIRAGYAPNLLVSINWTHAPSAQVPDPVLRNGLLRDRMKSFLRRAAPSVPFVWIEVREKPRMLGEGLHMAVHVRRDVRARFAAAVGGWVAIDADYVRPSAVDVREVGPRWWDRRDYMLKGGDADVCARYQCGRFGKPYQGVIEGPRVRVAHSIGPTARKVAEAALSASAGRAANG